jgi:hypothetical protein
VSEEEEVGAAASFCQMKVTTEEGATLTSARNEWVDVTWHAGWKTDIGPLSRATALSRGDTISRSSEKQECVQRDSIVLTVSCNSSRKAYR